MERVYKELPEGIEGWYCNPEINTECDKRFCKYNTNAIDRLCDATRKKEFALKTGQKAIEKAYPHRKKRRFNFYRGDRWVGSTSPRELARDKK